MKNYFTSHCEEQSDVATFYIFNKLEIASSARELWRIRNDRVVIFQRSQGINKKRDNLLSRIKKFVEFIGFFVLKAVSKINLDKR